MSKSIANPEPAKVIGRASECMRRLLEAGLTYDALQIPITDPKMRKRLVQFWLSCSKDPTFSEPTAGQPSGGFCRGCGKPKVWIQQHNTFSSETGHLEMLSGCSNVNNCGIACHQNGGHFYKSALSPYCSVCKSPAGGL